MYNELRYFNELKAQYVGFRRFESCSKPQPKRKCVAKFGVYPYFRVKVGIKNDTANDTIVSFTVSVMGWVMGLEPTTPGTTIQCSAN